MKKPAALMAVLLLIFTFNGCSETLDEWTANLGEKVIDAAQNYMDNRTDDEENDSGNSEMGDNVSEDLDTEAVAAGVQVTDASVVMTLDYEGIAQVHEFFYDESGYLTAATVSMDCKDADSIHTCRRYFEYANESTAFFKNIKTEGNIVSGEYTDTALETYRYYSKEELAEELRNLYF